jgi:hypothetical protein
VARRLTARPAALAGVLALLASCAGTPPAIDAARPYGGATPDGRRTGIELAAPLRTPVVAAADGTVARIGPNLKRGGYFVRLTHGTGLDSYYDLLSQVDVTAGQTVKRGDRLGLSGLDSTGRGALLFALCRTGGSCTEFADTQDPAAHWLGGQLQCFSPRQDYPAASRDRMTAPLACGGYATRLNPPPAPDIATPFYRYPMSP